MSEIYKDGRRFCVASALSHLDIADSLLDSESRGAAISHSLLAHEEASKAVFCSMVASGLVDSKEIRSVFRSHDPKALLFHELFGGGVRIQSVGTRHTVIVRGNQLKDEVLRSLASHHRKSLSKHNTKRNRGFYVDFSRNRWMTPDDIPPKAAQEEVRKNRTKVFALLVVSNILMELRPQHTLMDNFKIQDVGEKGDSIIVSYDEL